MSQQWQGGGYQYPQQTGYPGYQPNQFGGGGINPQPTGYPQQFNPQQQQPQIQPQRTGYPSIQNAGGFPVSNFGANRPGFGSGFQGGNPPPPVPPLPSNLGVHPNLPLQTGNLSFLNNPPPSRFGAVSPLISQPTGFQQPMQTGAPLRPLVPQATGFIDPRLQMMSSSFLPANGSSPYASSGAPQLQQNPQLQQSILQHNQEQRGTNTARMPWALTKAEKKNYDGIFRAWDTSGSGFINGDTALQVFGQSGLEKNDLARIW